MSLFAELRRRNVFRTALLYLVASWVLMQVAELLFDVLDLPVWTTRLVLGLLVLGFVPALILSWIFELTPEGVKRAHEVAPGDSIAARSSRRINMLIVALLAVAIGLLLWDRFGRMNATRGFAARPSVGAASARSARLQGRGVDAAVSIVVLPFVNVSDDKQNEYFSDGLTEELLNLLANIPGLRVIARTSSFAYKGKDVKVADVARELDVDHVLEGSVRKAGDRIRITAQLVRASDSSHLWSETYDRELEDVFAVQDEISKEVVSALRVRLLGSDTAQPGPGGTSNPKAYEEFLRALYLLNQGQKEETLRAALAAYDSAIAADPSYAQAHAGRATALAHLASNGYEPFAAGFEQARAAALRAAELAPDLAVAHVTLGWVASVIDYDVAASRDHLERAVSLDPGNARRADRVLEDRSRLPAGQSRCGSIEGGAARSDFAVGTPSPGAGALLQPPICGSGSRFAPGDPARPRFSERTRWPGDHPASNWQAGRGTRGGGEGADRVAAPDSARARRCAARTRRPGTHGVGDGDRAPGRCSCVSVRADQCGARGSRSGLSLAGRRAPGQGSRSHLHYLRPAGGSVAQGPALRRPVARTGPGRRGSRRLTPD